MNFHKMILIGVLFQFLDFNFGPVDIIPDFIGFLIIASAFAQVKARYAPLGVVSSALLTVVALVEIFYPQLQEPTVVLPLQLLSIVIGLITILYFACIFSVSKEVLPQQDSLFPILFIGAQLFMHVFMSIGTHLAVDIAEGFMVFALIALFGLYVYFIAFLWKRKNEEQAMREAQKE